jgi:hypothetical protein
MCYFCHAQLLEITYAENIKSPFGQHSCRNAKVVEVFCNARCRFSTRCRPSIHRPPALRVPAEMPTALSWAPLHADMHVVRCCARAYHREQRRHAIPITLAASHCPTARDFVPWRFLDAGRFSAWSVSSSRRPKTCTKPEELNVSKTGQLCTRKLTTNGHWLTSPSGPQGLRSVGQRMSALPGYFRRQFVLLSRARHRPRCRDI